MRLRRGKFDAIAGVPNGYSLSRHPASAIWRASSRLRASKILLGRTKPRDGFDLLHAGGMSYPSGHASNAVLSWGILAYLIYRYAKVDRYQGRLASAGVVLISLTVCIVSLIRHTHWFSDLLGGLFIGSALLVAVIAIDRYVPSKSQLH